MSAESERAEASRFVQSLTTAALIHRLRIAAIEPRSYTAAERAAMMYEAAERLAAQRRREGEVTNEQGES